MKVGLKQCKRNCSSSSYSRFGYFWICLLERRQLALRITPGLIEAIRLFLAFASYMGFTVYQMDVKSAFLYGTIKEEVYVHQSFKALLIPCYPNKGYKVIKDALWSSSKPSSDATTDSIFISPDKYVADISLRSLFLSIRTATTPIESNKPLDSRDSPFELKAFLDSDYGGASLDRKSTTGGCQFLGRRLISWQCKKQTIMANSTTEAEYVAAATVVDVLWIQNQMIDYGFNFMNTKIHIDNESTISVIKNHVAHSKTKHIEIRFHFIRDCYKKRLIEVIKIHTTRMLQTFSPKDLMSQDLTFWWLALGC
ncbi:putative ribonuclease H-like domain-containing protein [Tanacetum coccineum]